MSVRIGVVFCSSAAEVGLQSAVITSVGSGALFGGGLASMGLGGSPQVSTADNPFGSVTQSEW